MTIVSGSMVLEQELRPFMYVETATTNQREMGKTRAFETSKLTTSDTHLLIHLKQVYHFRKKHSNFMGL